MRAHEVRVARAQHTLRIDFAHRRLVARVSAPHPAFARPRRCTKFRCSIRVAPTPDARATASTARIAEIACHRACRALYRAARVRSTHCLRIIDPPGRCSRHLRRLRLARRLWRRRVRRTYILPCGLLVERHGHARPSHVPHRIASHPSHLLRMQSAVIHRTYLQHARSRSSDSHEPHMPHPTSHRVASHRIASKRIVHRVRVHPSTPECTPDAPNRGDSWYIVTHEPLPRAFDDFGHHDFRSQYQLSALARSRRRSRRVSCSMSDAPECAPVATFYECKAL